MASKPFGDLLREYRLARGYSQDHLAEIAGVSLEAIGSLERGTRRAPHRSTLALLVRCLELDEKQSLELEEAASKARARVQIKTTGQAVAANNLPADVTSFVGRDKDVGEIETLVSDHRLVTVTGAPGIGKTRVALRAATGLLDAAFESVWFVDLSTVSGADRVPMAILSALKIPESQNRPSLDTLTFHLKGKHVLLILDNCEHVIDSATSTADALLQCCPHAHILATSREILGAGGELVVRVPTLNISDAVALFADRAMNANSRFALTEELQPHVSEICRRLDGIPLAIELAAARTNILPPAALAHNLNKYFLTLTGGKRSVPPRHRTVHALLDWSYELLDKQEQRMLRRLSIFVGGFSLELATAICGDDEALTEAEMLCLLASLVDKSLLQLEPGPEPTRYRLLETTRQYAYKKLCERKEDELVALSHARSVLAFVERFSLSDVISDTAWKTQLQPEIDNWRVAVKWALGPSGDRVTGQRLAAAFGRGRLEDAGIEDLRWIRKAIETADEATPSSVRASLELAHASRSMMLGDTTNAVSSAHRALQLFEEAEDSLGVALAQMFIGEWLAWGERHDEAENTLREALDRARGAGAEMLAAAATCLIGAVRGLAGDIATARNLIREGMAMYDAGGCGRRKARQAMILGELEFQAGNAETALSLSLESLEGFREFNQILNVAGALSNAAGYAIALGHLDQAQALAREAIIIADEGGFTSAFAWASQHLAAISAFRVDYAAYPDRSTFVNIARALGFVDACFDKIKMPRAFTEQQEYDKVICLLRGELGDALESLMLEGSHWSKEWALRQLLGTAE